MKNTVVIYHRADFDGIFCREIARKFLGDKGVEYVGWDFGDAPLEIPLYVQIYILDLPVDRVFGIEFAQPPKTALIENDWLNRIVWIDHHKSSIATHPKVIPGYRIDGVAACRLAWQWFAHQTDEPGLPGTELPNKKNFVDRQVSEPSAVRLAGEYDIWDKRNPDAELFQHGLPSVPPERIFPLILEESIPAKTCVDTLLNRGESIQYVQTQQNKSIIKAYGFTFVWEGLTFLCCNHARFNSHLFTAGLRPEHDACFGFCYDGTNGMWRVSLYHAPGKEQHDLSLIASKYGGGGHRGACGFRTHKLPFLGQ